MLPVKRLQKACPRCREQLPRLFGHGTVSASRHHLPISSQSRTSTQPRRFFSTTRPKHQESHTEPKLPSENDVETVVRQAKKTFGDTLPRDYLTNEEYKVYERLYGAPLRETTLEDLGIGLSDQFDSPETAARDVSADGTLQAEYTLHDSDETVALDPDAASLGRQQDEKFGYIRAVANNQREYDALLKLKKDLEDSLARMSAEEQEAIDARQEEEEVDNRQQEQEDDEDVDDEESEEPGALLGSSAGDKRLHPLSVEGKFRTFPSTVELPRGSLAGPIEELLRRTDNTHIKEAAMASLGGRGLPFSTATPISKQNVPMTGLGLQAGHHRMTEIKADTFLATITPGIFASTTSVLVEVRKRLGSDWIRGLVSRSGAGGPRVLDAGAGGAGLAAWNRVFRAEWKALRERGDVQEETPPEQLKGERTVIVGSDALRNRLSRFLFNTTFLPRLPDYVHSVENAERLLDAPQVQQPKKVYDVIIATHLLMGLKEAHKRRELLNNLWAQLNPDGGVLIVLEKGHPRGFEAVADVRQRLLDEFIIPPAPQAAPDVIEEENRRVREPGMIVAPCTNHSKCPMYLSEGLSPGRKDFCHFRQRFRRPKFLQKIHGEFRSDHEDVEFSYLAVRRGGPNPIAPSLEALGTSPLIQGSEATDRAFVGYENSSSAPHALSLPRNLLSPLKRRGHVTMDLCTPEGRIERWTVSKSFSRQAYHDARKARWGDLWALGAKVRVPRNVRLGRGGQDGGTMLDGGVRSQQALQSGKKGKARVIEVSRGPDGLARATEKGGRVVHERRTKRGRKPKMRDLMEELAEMEILGPGKTRGHRRGPREPEEREEAP